MMSNENTHTVYIISNDGGRYPLYEIYAMCKNQKGIDQWRRENPDTEHQVEEWQATSEQLELFEEMYVIYL